MSKDEDEETVVRQRLWRLMPGAAADGLDLPTDAAVPPVSGHGRTPPPIGAPPPVAGWPTMPLPVRVTADPGSIPPRSPGPDARTVDDGTVDVARERTDDDAPPRALLPGPRAFDPGRRGVRALTAVAVLVVLAAGLWAWRSRPRVEPVVAVTGAAVTSDPSGVAGADPAVPDAAPTGELVVAVAGKVRRPGLVRLPAGARVADALDAAGGASPGVDVAMLNPARRVSDGELILVGVPAPTTAVGAAPGTGPGVGGAPGVGGRVNLNTATAAQLDALPGVGPVLAQRIIEHRDRHGGFRSVGDLRQVSGIGDARYEQLKDLVTV